MSAYAEPVLTTARRQWPDLYVERYGGGVLMRWGDCALGMTSGEALILADALRAAAAPEVTP